MSLSKAPAFTASSPSSPFLHSYRIMVKAPSTSQMDVANRALCYTLRNPPPGVKKTKLCDIVKQKLVKKVDGSVPTQGAISEAAMQFKAEKDTRGRKTGWRKTSKEEDKTMA